MSDEILTPDEGTEQENVTPQENVEVEQPQVPVEEAEAEVADPQVEQPETPAQPDYRQKFTEQARENILQNERIKVVNSRIESLTKQDTPTDEAMRALYSNWDELDSVSKNFYIKQEAQEMRQRRLEAQQHDLAARLKLEDEVESVMDDPKFSKLKGKEAEFKRFALKPANRGLSAEVIAKAFLFDVDEESPAPVNPPPKTREALPTGSGGPRGDVNPKKISLEEAANIRKTDYKRYIELVNANAIEELE